MRIRNILFAIIFALANISSSFAASNTASADFSIDFPEYLKIETVTSAVLIANITDKTGNLYSPLTSKFKVISNCAKEKSIYLKSEVVTENGIEPSMFYYGGRVYVAFANMNNRPSSEALTNCKMGTHPKYSPGVVAYPVTSIIGAKSQYQPSIEKYKIQIKNGVTNIAVNIGSNVLKNSFASNDPKGFYQATLSLTESEI